MRLTDNVLLPISVSEVELRRAVSRTTEPCMIRNDTKNVAGYLYIGFHYIRNAAAKNTSRDLERRLHERLTQS